MNKELRDDIVDALLDDDVVFNKLVDLLLDDDEDIDFIIDNIEGIKEIEGIK